MWTPGSRSPNLAPFLAGFRSTKQRVAGRFAVLAAWFLSVGMLPRQMAMAVLSWKLDASSRPTFLANLSRTIRRAMG
ncbi:hypothetical protein A4R29_08885 [Mesorhizobium ciceri biovar biserrulae]|nr:hypothetical protein A4R29_08885 [Mesorhizobium ciceri biovar biserrulae]